jgi:hypothetical protein
MINIQPARHIARKPANRTHGKAVCLMALAASLASFSAHASNLVANGSFESVGSNTQSYQLKTANPLPGWTLGNSTGIDCVVVGGVNNMCGTSYTGPPNNTTATFAVFPGVSPDGGNFLAGDADSTYSEAISQTISGLTIGTHYTLQFYQAGAQQAGFAGSTFDQWQVTFGTSKQDSTLMNVPAEGLIGWMSQTMTFTATATSETLQFLAVGGPTGDPPMALLDGVSLVAVPEPASIALMSVGAVGLAGLRRIRATRSAIPG